MGVVLVTQRPAARTGRGLVVYRLLREHPEWGVDDLAAELGTTPDDVRADLDDLVRTGLVNASGSTSPFHVVDPELGLSLLAERAREELVERTAEFERHRARLQDLLADAAAVAAAGRSEDGDEVLRGGDVAARLEVLVRQARTGLRLLLTAGAGPGRLAAQPWGSGARGSGERLPVRLLIPNDALEDPETRGFLHWSGAATTTVRGAAAVPLPAVVCDDDVVLLPVDPQGGGREAVVSRRPAVVQAVAALFEAVWAGATPLADGAPALDDDAARPDPVTRAGRTALVDEAELVRLLRTGATDESVARSLGVSARTVQRAVADLQAELGAATRFQAGVLAARRGLAGTA